MKSVRTSAAILLCIAASLLPASPRAQAVDPVVVMHSDFEDGTTQGWFGRGAAALSVNADAAHAGANGLRTTGRTATWNGPGRNVLNTVQKGATYAIEAQVRLVPGQTQTAVQMTMQRTPDGGSTVFERVASATVTDAGWTVLRGEYSFQAESTELQLYLESASATVAFDADDIVITMIAPAPGGPPDETGIITGFEGGTRQGWNPRIGSETLAVTDAAAHTGRFSLLTTTRTQVYAGPALNVFGRIGKGKQYSFSLWLRLAPGEAPAQLRFSIERRLNGTPNFATLVGNKTVTADAWVQFTGQYTLANDVDFLSVYAESNTGTPSFYLDDFEMTFIPPLPIEKDIPRLKDVLDFPVGTAVDRTDTVGVASELAVQHFSQVTPGNAMKWDATEPTEGNFTFTEADALVDFAVAHGMRVRGHTLLWHNQTPAWVFNDANGNPLTNSPEHKALLLQRLERHIRAVAGHFAGKVYAWDVVNEVIDEYQPDGLRRSRWYQIAGMDYLRTAFRVAHEVVPDAVLYINDYNTHIPRKRDFLYSIVQTLSSEGIPVEGVGHQEHINVERPTIEQIEQSIQKFAALGVRQEVTELDMSVYGNAVDSLPSIPPDTITAQGYRYRDLFDMLRRNRSLISSVTLWGSSDANTWLKNFPIPRLDLPLLFDERLQAKPAYWGIVDPSRLPHLTRKLTVPQGSPKVDGKRELEWDLLPMTKVETAFSFQVRWDRNNLYVLAEVADTTRDGNDSVDVFVDDNNGKTAAYEPDDAAYTTKRGSKDVKEGPSGYTVEKAIPLRTLGTAGRQVGLDIRVKDTAHPEQAVSWNDTPRNGQDTDTSRWGTITLVPAVATVQAPLAFLTPVIDGQKDAIWLGADSVTTNVQIIGSGGAKATARVLWDNNFLYLYVTVTDPVLDESSPNVYEHDSVEIFVDPDNSKATGFDDDDGQYRVSFTNRQSVAGGFTVADNLTSAARTVPGGYVVEARIALDTVRPLEGALIGLEIQVNDGTGGRRTAASTWNDPTGVSYVNTSRWGVAQFVRH